MSMFGLSRELKMNDVLELSKLYEAEFNKPDLHDRVLVFDVVASCLRRDSDVNIEENEGSENQTSKQSEDGRHGETAEIESEETGMNVSDENETETHNCEIASKYANGCRVVSDTQT